MPFRKIERRKALLILYRYDKEGFIQIPSPFRRYFGQRVRLLFDPEKNLVALQPSEEEDDYPTSRWRVWCSKFFQEYNIPAQKVPARWDDKNNYLIAKIRRG